MIELGMHPESGAPIVVRIGRFGPYVQVGVGDDAMTASIPDDVAPADLTAQRAAELVEDRAKGPSSLGDDPATGLPVYLMNGRFGPYVQLGETPEKGSKDKARRASLSGDGSAEAMTLDRALELLALPRVVGRDPDRGEDILANFGRFGPYVKRGEEFRSLATDAAVFKVTLDEAIELFNQEKPTRRSAGKKVLRELGDHPETGATVQLIEGRYGSYVSDGTTNASLPKDTENESVTLDAAVGLLRARKDAKPARGSRAARPATRRRKTATRKRPA